MSNNSNGSLKEKLLFWVLSGAMALGGSAIAVYSKIESHEGRLNTLEQLVTEIRHDVKILLRR